MTGRLAAFLAALVAGAVAIVAAQQPAFRGLGEAVNIPASVRGGNKPVGGLTAADFALFDNGVKQTIQTVSIETQPIDVTLLLDVSRSVQGTRLEQLKSSVIETSLLLRPTDRLRLIAVQHVLREVFPFQPGGTPPPVAGLTAAGGTSLYDGIAAAIMGATEPGRRQLIIAYTDGQDTISTLPIEMVRDLSDVSEAVVQLVVSTARPGGSARPDAVPAARTLNEFATRTGGQLFVLDNATAITDAFKQAIEDFRTSYVLGYVPTGVKSGGWHDVQVKVTSGNYEVRARKGYSGG